MKKIRAALFGTGSMARLHAKNALKEGVEIIGVCSRSRASALEFGKAIGVSVPYYPDCAEMLDETKPDALFVCVPPFAHNGEVETAAKRGVHLFLEKPLSLSLERSASMCTAAEKNKVITQVDFHHRFHPLVQRLKLELTGKSAGRPLLIQARFFCNSLHSQWWRDIQLSGGQLFEQVIHVFDLIIYFLGPVQKVRGFQSNLCHQNISDYTVEDTSVVSLLAESGAMASVAASNCAAPERWELALHLICEKLTAFYSSIETGFIKNTDKERLEEAKENSLEYPAGLQAGPQQKGGSGPGGLEPHGAALHEFLEAIRTKKETTAPIQAGYKAQELVTRVLQSLE